MLVTPKQTLTTIRSLSVITSKEASDNEVFLERLAALKDEGCETNRLLTAVAGMSAEAGEFTEIVKKMIFQGKPYNDDNKKHLLIELGDVMWYVMQACAALGVSLDEVVFKHLQTSGTISDGKV